MMNAWNCPALNDPFYAGMDAMGLEPRFGLGLLPSDLGHIVPRPPGAHHLPTGYRRPWSLARQVMKDINNDQRTMHFSKDGFQASVDVHHFQPNEITVKTVDYTVIIEGKHEERDDGHGSVQRHFVRKYVLPKEYDMNNVHSNLSSDGVLTIKAPLPAILSTGAKNIQIVNTGMPAHLSLKDHFKDHQHEKCGVPSMGSNNGNNTHGKVPAVQNK